jgi:general stress protein YciG
VSEHQPPGRDDETGSGSEDSQDDTPETPPTEPPPVPVQDPPPKPGPEGPYVVSGVGRKQGDETGSRRTAVEGVRKERRGFASMSPEKQREIASKGGRAAHEKGTAHEWTPEEARNAGRKGGQISRGGRGRLVPAPDVNTGTTAPASGSEPGRVG